MTIYKRGFADFRNMPMIYEKKEEKIQTLFHLIRAKMVPRESEEKMVNKENL